MISVSRKSKYRKFWYQHVLDMITSYDILSKEDNEVYKKWKGAIDYCLERLSHEQLGEIKVKAVIMVFIKQTDNIDGASYKLYVCRNTISVWLNDFVYSVGYAMGYK